MKTKMSRLEKFWVLYDVGNSAFTLLMSTIIPIYYKNMASANGSLFAKKQKERGLHRISKLRHLDLHADCGGFRTGAWCGRRQ